MNNSIAHRLARHITARHEMSDELADWMNLLLADFTAVTIGGVSKDSAGAVRAYVQLADTPSADRPSRVLGTDQWASVEHAALVNGTTSHGLELDDTFEQGSSHPGVVIFPALLALCDAGEYSQTDLLDAAVIGYDVMCSLGVYLGAPESYDRGFHPTAVTGIVGASAAVARLKGATVAQSTNAVAIAANMAAGSLEFLGNGSWTKRLNAGHAASNGVRAALLGMAGFDAPQTAFEGRNGYLKQYGHGAVEGRELTLEFGRHALDTSIKFYPCCRYMHGNIDLLRDIAVERPDLTAEAVQSIDVGVIQAGQTLVSQPPERKRVVKTPVDAQFNMPFGAAIALATGEATVDQFDCASQVANEVSDWMEKVHSYTSDRLEAAYPKEWHAEVKVTLSDGTVIERYSEAFVGSPNRRATWEQIERKAAGVLGEATGTTVVETIKNSSLRDPVTRTMDMAYPMPHQSLAER